MTCSDAHINAVPSVLNTNVQHKSIETSFAMPKRLQAPITLRATAQAQPEHGQE